MLIESASSLMRNHSLPNFAGFMVINLGADIRVSAKNVSTQEVLMVQYVLNDSYFGPIDFAVQAVKRRHDSSKAINLLVVDKEELSDPVIHATYDKAPPFFIGNGTIDFKCGNCKVTLAQRS